MTPYIGQGLLLSILLIGLIPFLGRWSVQAVKGFHLTQTGILLLCFFWLFHAHITSDFSLLNVVMHSHTEKPWLYKVAGVWGNHEGSMLLWVLLQAGWGLAAVFSLTGLTEGSRQRLHLLSLTLTSCFTLFLIFACDPFTPIAEIPDQGRDLNPLLQDPLLAIHPPCLYMGYVGTSVSFLVLIALQGQSFAQKINDLKTFIRLTWVFLTAGLVLGSFWAYYELGWGGWWFWDPVENAALVPWLVVTALLHLIKLPRDILLTHEKALRWLVIAAYASCLMGTYLVRSGALTSVHSFAVDPERGVMLLLLCVIVLGAGVLASSRPPRAEPSLSLPLAWSLLQGGVWLLAFVAVVITFATLYPLIMQVFNMPLSVGPSFYQKTVLPMLQPILLLMAVMPWLFRPKGQRALLVTAFILSALTIVSLWALNYLSSILQTIALTLAFALLYSTLLLSKSFKSLSGSKKRMVIAHAALAIAVVGMALSSALEEEKLVAVKPGEVIEFAGSRLKFESVKEIEGPNYMAQEATLLLNDQVQLQPQKRFYWTQGIIHGETAIHSTLLHHTYVALGDQYQNGQWSLRLYHKPYINLLWLGAILLVIAGLWRSPSRKALILAFCLISNSWALEPHEQLSDTVLENRAKALGNDLLCPSCAGQPLNDSVAEEALLLRKKVRDFLKDGKSDQEIIDWFVAHYGEQVLRDSPLSIRSWILWGFSWVGYLALLFYFIKRSYLLKR